MAPDNPAGDGDAGTVTSTVLASSGTPPADASPALAASPSLLLPTPPHPPPPPLPQSPTSDLPTPQAPELPVTSSGLEPAESPSASALLTATTTTTTTTTSTPTAPADTTPTPSAAPLIELDGAAGAARASPSNSSSTDMSNHSFLHGRPAAATGPSQSPSHPTSYGPDSPAHAASSTASPAHHGHSPAHPTSTTPTNQFASYSIAPTSQLSDAQRPVHANGPNAVTLPSMRTIDAIAQQQQQQQQQQQPPQQPAQQPQHQQLQQQPVSLSHAMNGPIPPGSAPGQSYYSHSAVGATPSYGLHPELSRYPLPHDPRLGGSRGSKKEIKRRTKTGCLTCRKRRIKCDETHPTCNNCKKSKRDCLGYDPIFRQQPTQTGSILQPAPSPTASLPSSNSPGSVVGNSRQLNSYTAQPSMLPASYPPHPTPPTATTSPALNPAYHANSIPVAPTSVSANSEPRYDYPSTTNAGVRPYQPATTLDPPRQVDHRSNTTLDHRIPEQVPKMKIAEIIDSLGPTPTPPQVPASEETFSEITKVYHEMYAAALAAFFETTWYYFAENGIMSFPKHPPLLEQMGSFLKILEAVKANDHTQMAYSGILETRIVWELACTAFQTPERSNGAMRVHLPLEGDGAEARSRLLVVDTLLCGEYLANNPLSPPVADPDMQRTRQFDFWYNLADFIRHRENPEAPLALQAREEVLGRMRRLLDGRENRDVLYSIAVVRHLAPNFGPNYGATVPQHLDETDPKNRLAVASKFIMDESQVTGGTTNVVRRISDIACRAFVNPGVNIARTA